MIRTKATFTVYREGSHAEIFLMQESCLPPLSCIGELKYPISSMRRYAPEP